MRLRVKLLNLKTGGFFISAINEEDAKLLGIHPKDRAKLTRIKKGRSIISVLDTSVGKNVKRGEIGLFNETARALGVKEGMDIKIEPTERPKSIQYIKDKLDDYILNKEEYSQIVDDIVHNNLSDVEIAYFVSACYMSGMTLEESYFLTKAVEDNSQKLNLKNGIICDKHSIGGIPGNRTTMVVVPIIAAAGYTIPKTSSRSITSPAGTSDTMEVLAPVLLDPKKVTKIVRKTKGCMIWESSLNPSGADKKLIGVRHPMSIDPEGILLASIMAKKKVVGATHVLIDIPVGKTAKVKTKKDANKLGKKFTKLGTMLGIKMRVVVTDGSQPIGNGIGPALEVKDVIAVLQNEGPSDLRNKSVKLATELLSLVGAKRPRRLVRDLIDSGAAYQKFIEIIQAQGGRKNIRIPNAKYHYSVLSRKKGKIREIDNKYIAKIARFAGAPRDLPAGVYIRVHNGYKVNKGDCLFTIYANSQNKLDSAKKYAFNNEGIVIK